MVKDIGGWKHQLSGAVIHPRLPGNLTADIKKHATTVRVQDTKLATPLDKPLHALLPYQ